MTTVELRKFFVYGVENAEGEIFRMIKEATLATSVATDAVKFYHSIGFNKVIATNCNDVVFIKDNNGRLLSFVVDVCHTKATSTKEYRTAYWALKEVERQAEAVAEKAAAAAAKVDVEESREVAAEIKVIEATIASMAERKNTTIKGSVEVKSPHKKKTTYYAVRKGRTIGIFTDWAEAEASVKGFSDPKFKKFSVYKDAEDFMKGGDDE